MRASHWALAASVLVCLWSYNGGPLHEWIGYAALALALLRIWHGFNAGDGLARYARFSQFVRGPAAVLAHARALATRQEPRYIGHNPLGGWMIVALLACALLATMTGALYVTDRFWGYGWLATLHAVLGWAFAVLVPLHVLGVVFSSLRHRENLAAAMVTGRKRGGPAADVEKS